MPTRRQGPKDDDPGKRVDDGKKLAQSKQKTASGLSYSVEDVLRMGQNALDKLDYASALTFFEKAHAMTPKDTAIMDTIGEICLELGDVERAEEILKKSIDIAPKQGSAKWLYMGQICEGIRAADAYRRGLDLLHDERKSASSVSNEGTTRERWCC